MTGWATIERIRRLEELAAKLGLKIREPEHRTHAYSSATASWSGAWIDEVASDSISLTPVDNRHTCWRPGTAVFTGTVEEARYFLQGVEFVYITDESIGLSNDKKRKAADIKYIERMQRLELARKKKEEQKKVWDILKHGKSMEDDYDDEEVPF